MPPFVPVLKCTILLHVRSVLRLNARPKASTCASAAPGLSGIPDSQTRRRCFPALLTPTPWFISVPAPISVSTAASLGCAASYGDQQMEAVRACATVIPQFNSLLGFFPGLQSVQSFAANRCPQFAEHLLLPWDPKHWECSPVLHS